jgi:hypothetical protein
MFIARPAAEIEPQECIFSSNAILPGPIRPCASRSMRRLNEGSDLGDDFRMFWPIRAAPSLFNRNCALSSTCVIAASAIFKFINADRTSELGHFQTFGESKRTSALPPEAAT